MVEKKKHNIYHVLMKKSCSYFDKKNTNVYPS